MSGVTTDWQRPLIDADLNAETATGWAVFLPSRVYPESTAPYCEKPLPFSSSAVTLNCWPDTLNDAARAPCARATPIAAVAATLGTMTTANRFHLVPPRTWDSIFPPSRTYISWPWLPLRLDGSAGQGWEKCYVLGKGSACTRRHLPRPNHRRSPPSDNHWSRLNTHHAQPCWT